MVGSDVEVPGNGKADHGNYFDSCLAAMESKGGIGLDGTVLDFHYCTLANCPCCQRCFYLVFLVYF